MNSKMKFCSLFAFLLLSMLHLPRDSLAKQRDSSSEEDSYEVVKRQKKSSKQSRLLGSSECTWGPSSICSSLERATNCKSLLDCAERHWSNRRVKPSGPTDQCLRCQRILSDVHMKKERAIRSLALEPFLLKHATQLIGLRNLSNGGISPAVLCHLEGLCSGHLERIKDTDIEQDLAAATWIRLGRLMRNEPGMGLEKATDLLLRECHGDFTCQQLVLHFLPFLYDEFGWFLSGQREFSDGSPLAHSAEAPLVRFGLRSPSSSHSIWCDVCLSSFHFAKSALTHNASAENARSLLKQFCKMLGQDAKRKCELYIDEHIESWMENVETNMNVTAICTSLKLCPLPSSVPENMACDKCRDFVNGLRRRIICRIKKVFNLVMPNICRFFGRYEQSCLSQTFKLKDKIIGSIESVLNTEVLCKRFCATSTRFEFTSDAVFREIAAGMCGRRGSSPGCVEDTTVMLRHAYGWVDSIQDQEEAVDEPGRSCHTQDCVDPVTACKACSALHTEDLKIIMWNWDEYTSTLDDLLADIADLCPRSGTDGSDCAGFVNSYGRAIVDALLSIRSENGDYGSFCSRAKACRCPDDNCLVCSFVSSQLASSLTPSRAHHSAEEVNKALDGVCADIDPDKMNPRYCEAFVDNFRMTIVALLAKRNITVKNLCVRMGVCMDHTDCDPDEMAMSPCEICRFTVDIVKHELSSNRTEEEISRWLQRQCAHLPGPVAARCAEIVERNLPRMIELIDLMADTEFVCRQLRLCSRVGGCQFGRRHSGFARATSDYSGCSVCQMAAIAFRGWLEMNHGVEVVTRVMNSTCEAVFSGERRLDCLDAVKSIANLLSHAIPLCDSLKVCRFARFCPPEGIPVGVVNSRLAAALKA